MGDVAGVEAPFACGKGVEGFEGVELGDGGGGEVFLLADGSEGLGERRWYRRAGGRAEAGEGA